MLRPMVCLVDGGITRVLRSWEMQLIALKTWQVKSLTPIAVEPSFIASNEYSTWKRRPSGEKVLVEAVRRQTPVGTDRFLLYPSVCDNNLAINLKVFLFLSNEPTIF